MDSTAFTVFSRPRCVAHDMRKLRDVSSPHILTHATGGLRSLYKNIGDETNHSWNMKNDTGRKHYRSQGGQFVAEPNMMLADRYCVQSCIEAGGQSAALVKAQDCYQQMMPVVIKITHKSYLAVGLKEVDTLRRLNGADPGGNSHTVRLLNAFMIRDHVCLVFPFLNPTPLTDVLAIKGFNEEQTWSAIKKISVRLLSVLAFLRCQNTIHADIKPDNILVNIGNDLDTVTLIDFGNAIHHTHREVSLYYTDFELQTLPYRAPEVLLGNPFSVEVDMWSLGCVLAELYTGHPLFLGSNRSDILRKMLTVLGPLPMDMCVRGKFHTEAETVMHSTKGLHKVGSGAQNLMSAIPGLGNYQFASFLSGLLVYHPDKRLSPWEALQHPFLASEICIPYFLPDTGTDALVIQKTDYSFKQNISTNVLRRYPSTFDLLRHGTADHQLLEDEGPDAVRPFDAHNINNRGQKGSTHQNVPHYKGIGMHFHPFLIQGENVSPIDQKNFSFAKELTQAGRMTKTPDLVSSHRGKSAYGRTRQSDSTFNISPDEMTQADSATHKPEQISPVVMEPKNGNFCNTFHIRDSKSASFSCTSTADMVNKDAGANSKSGNFRRKLRHKACLPSHSEYKARSDSHKHEMIKSTLHHADGTRPMTPVKELIKTGVSDDIQHTAANEEDLLNISTSTFVVEQHSSPAQDLNLSTATFIVHKPCNISGKTPSDLGTTKRNTTVVKSEPRIKSIGEERASSRLLYKLTDLKYCQKHPDVENCKCCIHSSTRQLNYGKSTTAGLEDQFTDDRTNCKLSYVASSQCVKKLSFSSPSSAGFEAASTLYQASGADQSVTSMILNTSSQAEVQCDSDSNHSNKSALSNTYPNACLGKDKIYAERLCSGQKHWQQKGEDKEGNFKKEHELCGTVKTQDQYQGADKVVASDLYHCSGLEQSFNRSTSLASADLLHGSASEKAVEEKADTVTANITVTLINSACNKEENLSKHYPDEESFSAEEECESVLNTTFTVEEPSVALGTAERAQEKDKVFNSEQTADNSIEDECCWENQASGLAPSQVNISEANVTDEMLFPSQYNDNDDDNNDFDEDASSEHKDVQEVQSTETSLMKINCLSQTPVSGSQISKTCPIYFENNGIGTGTHVLGELLQDNEMVHTKVLNKSRLRENADSTNQDMMLQPNNKHDIRRKEFSNKCHISASGKKTRQMKKEKADSCQENLLSDQEKLMSPLTDRVEINENEFCAEAKTHTKNDKICQNGIKKQSRPRNRNVVESKSLDLNSRQRYYCVTKRRVRSELVSYTSERVSALYTDKFIYENPKKVAEKRTLSARQHAQKKVTVQSKSSRANVKRKGRQRKLRQKPGAISVAKGLLSGKCGMKSVVIVEDVSANMPALCYQDSTILTNEQDFSCKAGTDGCRPDCHNKKDLEDDTSRRTRRIFRNQSNDCKQQSRTENYLSAENISNKAELRLANRPNSPLSTVSTDSTPCPKSNMEEAACDTAPILSGNFNICVRGKDIHRNSSVSQFQMRTGHQNSSQCTFSVGRKSRAKSVKRALSFHINKTPNCREQKPGYGALEKSDTRGVPPVTSPMTTPTAKRFPGVKRVKKRLLQSFSSSLNSQNTSDPYEFKVTPQKMRPSSISQSKQTNSVRRKRVQKSVQRPRKTNLKNRRASSATAGQLPSNVCIGDLVALKSKQIFLDTPRESMNEKMLCGTSSTSSNDFKIHLSHSSFSVGQEEHNIKDYNCKESGGKQHGNDRKQVQVSSYKCEDTANPPTLYNNTCTPNNCDKKSINSVKAVFDKTSEMTSLECDSNKVGNSNAFHKQHPCSHLPKQDLVTISSSSPAMSNMNKCYSLKGEKNSVNRNSTEYSGKLDLVSFHADGQQQDCLKLKSNRESHSFVTIKSAASCGTGGRMQKRTFLDRAQVLTDKDCKPPVWGEIDEEISFRGHYTPGHGDKMSLSSKKRKILTTSNVSDENAVFHTVIQTPVSLQSQDSSEEMTEEIYGDEEILFLD